MKIDDKIKEVMETLKPGMLIEFYSYYYPRSKGEIKETKKCDYRYEHVCNLCNRKIVLKDRRHLYCPITIEGNPTFTIIIEETDFIKEEDFKI